MSAKRLQNLANFQTSVLRHALSFPAAKRVVYSTCSIHQEENENVVQDVLRHHGNQFKLVDVLPGITSRGNNIFKGSEKCLRLCPNKDCTNGFFVACFEKRKEGDISSDGEQIAPPNGQAVVPPGGEGLIPTNAVLESNELESDKRTDQNVQSGKKKKHKITDAVKPQKYGSTCSDIAKTNTTDQPEFNKEKSKKKKKNNVQIKSEDALVTKQDSKVMKHKLVRCEGPADKLLHCEGPTDCKTQKLGFTLQAKKKKKKNKSKHRQAVTSHKW